MDKEYDGPTGEDILQMGMDMFETTTLTEEQLAYILDMLRPSSYMLKNHTIKGKPMTFSIPNRNYDLARSHRPWQVGILNDTHPNLAVIKSRQLGLSELGVGKLLHFVDTHSSQNVKALYTFPTNRAMADFVKTRFNSVMEHGYYSTLIDKDMDSIETKRIRDSYLYFRSSSKPQAVEGIDVDYIALDEYDRVPPAAEASAIQSMESSNFQITNRWSTPTTPNMGIHQLFMQSDQYHYMHKCDKCNHWNQMKYEEYDPSNKYAGGNIKTMNPDGVDVLARTVAPGSFQFVCQACGKPLDRWYNGAWRPLHPERTTGHKGTRGYFISQMNAVWKSADDLKRDELNTRSKQSFYNYTLGMPYEDTKLVVTQEDILNNVYESTTPKKNRDGYEFVSVGVDWGNLHWVTVQGMKSDGQIDVLNMFAIEKPSATDSTRIGWDLEQLKLAIEPYQPDIIVADIGDSGDKIAQLINYYGDDTVFGCRYNSSPRSSGKINATWSENNNTVNVDKLTQNKRFITMLKEGRVKSYNNPEDEMIKLFIYHWNNVVIREEEDDKTGEFYQIITSKNNGED